MALAKLVVKNWQQFKKGLDKADKLRIRATTTALSKEGFRLRAATKDDLKAGTLGLAAKSLYRNEPNDPKYKPSRKSKRPPLSRLHTGITYFANFSKLSLDVGFLGTTPGTKWQAKLAEKSGDGYNVIINARRKMFLHRVAGIHLKQRTNSVWVPARDIMGEAERRGGIVVRNIIREYERFLGTKKL